MRGGGNIASATNNDKGNVSCFLVNNSSVFIAALAIKFVLPFA
jgi:hypothetical protein